MQDKVEGRRSRQHPSERQAGRAGAWDEDEPNYEAGAEEDWQEDELPDYQGDVRRADPRAMRRPRQNGGGLEVFDRSLQITHVWLNEIIREIGPDKRIAWHVLSAVLRTIRDRVQPELAVHLGAQLPLLVRGAYYDQFRLAWPPERTRSLDQFLVSIDRHIGGIGRPVDPHLAFHAVVRVLARHTSEGITRKLIDSMPLPIRRSWIDACRDIVGPDERRARLRDWDGDYGRRGRDWRGRDWALH